MPHGRDPRARLDRARSRTHSDAGDPKTVHRLRRMSDTGPAHARMRAFLSIPVLALLFACTRSTPGAPPHSVPSDDQEPVVAALPAIDTLLIREHTRALAHDSMGGRGAGSEGARTAARYIAERLAGLGALPVASSAAGAPSPYHLPVPLLRADVSEAKITVRAAGVESRHSHGDGFLVGRVGRDGLRSAAGPVAPLGGDSTNVARGAWLLVDRPLGEAAMRWLPEWQRAGVAGIIVRLASEAMVEAYHRQLGDVRWQLRDGPPDPVWQPDLPVLMIGPPAAARLGVAGARLEFEPRARIEPVLDYNVAGLIAGRYGVEGNRVALTAHYDHLGIQPAAGADSVFNGFSDNAAGVAMILAIAESVADGRAPVPLLVLFPAAEEVGLLGSLHFVRAYPELVARIHALVNLDAGAPPGEPTRWRLAAATRSGAGEIAARVVESHGWSHRSDAGSPNSDHWPFVALDVPSIFLIPDGAHEAMSDAAAESLRVRWDRYHRVDDEWHPDFPFAGLARYASLAREIAFALGSASLAPR